MSAFLGLAGLAGVVVSLVIIIKKVIKKQPKKKAVIALIACFLVFVGAFAQPSDKTGEIEETAAEEPIEIEKETSAPVETLAPTETPILTEAPIPTEASAPTESNDEQTDTIPLDTVINMLEATLKSSFGNNYKISTTDNLISITIWAEGVTQGAFAAKTGDKEAVDAWNTMMDSLLSLYNSDRQLMDTLGCKTPLMVAVGNDVNPDNVLAIASFGVIVYDIVNEIDLLNIG